MAFFRKAARDDVDRYLSVVTIGELRRGVEIIRHRSDKAQATRLENWLVGVLLQEFGRNILAVDEEIGQLWGRLRVPHPQHALDRVDSRPDYGDAERRRASAVLYGHGASAYMQRVAIDFASAR